MIVKSQYRLKKLQKCLRCINQVEIEFIPSLLIPNSIWVVKMKRRQQENQKTLWQSLLITKFLSHQIGMLLRDMVLQRVSLSLWRPLSISIRGILSAYVALILFLQKNRNLKSVMIIWTSDKWDLSVSLSFLNSTNNSATCSWWHPYFTSFLLWA